MSTRSHPLIVFISYSRRDSEIADALVDALQSRGFKVVIDRRNLPFGERWQAELAGMIRAADTVIWLVSDASVTSKWVNWELDEVARRAKRLVPVMIAGMSRAELPRQIGEIHILPAEGVFDLDADLDVLVRVLETDQAWLKAGTRLQDRAAEWIAKGRAPSHLLRSAALRDAEAWHANRSVRAPAPAQDVMDLLQASAKVAARRLRAWIVALIFAFAATAGLASVAVIQSHIAGKQRTIAERERDQALIVQSRFLLTTAAQEPQASDPVTQALLAIEALPGQEAAGQRPRPYVGEAEALLQASFKSMREARLLDPGLAPHANFQWATARHAIFEADAGTHIDVVSLHDGANKRRLDGRLVANADDDNGSQIIVQAPSGDLVVQDTSTRTDAVLIGRVASKRVLMVSQKSRRAIVARDDDSLALIDFARARGAPDEKDAAGGIDLGVTSAAIEHLSFSADGLRLLVGGDGGGATLWDVEAGKPIAHLAGQVSSMRRRASGFSPDGRFVVTIGDGSVRLFDAMSGQAAKELSQAPDDIALAIFTPDARRLVVLSADGRVRVFDPSTGALLHTIEYSEPFEIESDQVQRPPLSVFHGSSRLLVAAAYKEAAFIDLDNAAATSLAAGVRQLAFSSDGRHALVLSDAKNEVSVFDLYLTGGGSTGFKFKVTISPAIGDSVAHVMFDGDDGAGILAIMRDGPIVRYDATEFPKLQQVADGALSVQRAEDVLAAPAERNRGRHAASAGDVVVTFGSNPTRLYRAGGPQGWHRFVANLETAASESDASVRIFDLKLSRDGERVVGRSDAAWFLWESRSGRLLAHVPVARFGMSPHGAGVFFAAEDRKIISALDFAGLTVFDARDGAPIAMPMTGMPLQSLALSADGRVLAMAASDGRLRVFDVMNGATIADLPRTSNSVSTNKAAPSAAMNRKEAADSDVARTGVPDAAYWTTGGVAIDATGQTVAFVDGDGGIRLWRRVTGALDTVVSKSDWGVAPNLELSANARFLAVSGVDTVVWDTQRRLPVATAWDRFVAFETDERGMLLSSGPNGLRARRQRLFHSLDEFIAFARQTLPRRLTPEQRSRMFLDADPMASRWGLETATAGNDTK